MEGVSVLSFCFLLELLTKGQSALIRTQQTVLAAGGEDAELSCQLLEKKEVHQVTWQKVCQDEEKNVGSYSEYFGETVNPGFINKVEFKVAELQNNSIVIKNVTEEDEACYLCLFNTFPDGNLKSQTCLQVYELHQPVLHVRESKSPGESLVSCSATGRPAPTVTLTVTQQHLSFSQHNTTTVHNNNNTVTVTTTAVLSGLHDDSTQVGCAVRVLSAPHMEVIQRIDELKEKPVKGLNQESGSDQSRSRWPVIGTLFSILTVCGCAAALIFFWRRNQTQDRESNMEEMNETSAVVTPRMDSHSVTSDTSGLRKRTPPEEKKPNYEQQPSPTTKTLDYEECSNEPIRL